MVADQATSSAKIGSELTPAGDATAATQRIEDKLDVLMQLVLDGKMGYGVRAVPKKTANSKTLFEVETNRPWDHAELADAALHDKPIAGTIFRWIGDK